MKSGSSPKVDNMVERAWVSGSGTALGCERGSRAAHWVGGVVALLLAAGCSGEINVTGGAPGGSEPGDGLPGGAGSPGDGDGDLPAGSDVSDPGSDAPGDGPSDPFDPTSGDSDFGPEMPASAPRMVRLTHSQWENTVRDLLLLEAGDELPEFRPDPTVGGFLFDNDSTSLQVDESLWNGYQRAAVDLAALVAGDAARIAKIAPSGSDDATTGAETFIRGFGQRAHRRPLTDDQVNGYLALHAMAPALYPSAGAYEAGIQMLLEAFLQSPHFLYRIEASDEVAGEVIPLDDWEVASKLSYALWGTMPDDSLFTAAEAGELRDAAALRSQVERLVGDPRVEVTVQSFHAQLLEIEEFYGVSPSSTFYPDAPGDLGELAITEHELFIQDLVFEQDGGYREMLTSTRTFVNDDLAAIYGVSGTFDDTFVAVDLDPAERKGIFTQVGFLATNASSADPDPIHRGVFMAERIACLHIAAPDAATPPIPATEGRTNREVIEEHTEMPGSICASCHSTLINPFGFPFESYDAVGAFRTEDNGFPVDTTASPLIDGEPTMVDGALDLIEALADTADVHECYTRHWLEYLHGRPESEDDASITERLGDSSVRGELPVKQLLIEAVMSPTFLTRSTEELP